MSYLLLRLHLIESFQRYLLLQKKKIFSAMDIDELLNNIFCSKLFRKTFPSFSPYTYISAGLSNLASSNASFDVVRVLLLVGKSP